MARSCFEWMELSMLVALVLTVWVLGTFAAAWFYSRQRDKL
ncbi:MAG: hypothetical protein ABI846_01635 [Rudaea sp.]